MSDQPVYVHKFTSNQEINPYSLKMVYVCKENLKTVCN